MNSHNNQPTNHPRRALSTILHIVLPLVIITVGVLGAAHLIKTAPKASQKQPTRSALLVRTRPVEKTTQRVTIRAMGTVIAAQQIVLQPRVSGTIEELHPALVPGGRIAAGEELVKIDPSDYQVAIRQAEAGLAAAKAQRLDTNLELDRLETLKAKQAANKKEIDDATTAQAIAAANVAAAEAALEKARLDLERTTLKAPFSCVVLAENVDLGSLVTTQTQLATLVGTDEYWVRVSVPVDQLHWISFPDADGSPGSTARVQRRLGSGITGQWTGRVVRLLGDLEPQGRMARVLVSIPNPLDMTTESPQQQPLLIGSYVDVEIQGQEIQDVFTLTRNEVRDGNTVWIKNDKNELDIQTVVIAFAGRDRVLISQGLEPGQRLITTDLSAPVAGMPLRDTNDPKSTATNQGGTQ